MIREGRVLKNYNGYYYVDSDGSIFACKLKGKFKHERFSLATGDFVVLESTSVSEGMISEVLPRKNYLQRPTIANLDLFILTFACAEPDFSFLIADKLIAMAERGGVPLLVVINKSDLAAADNYRKIKEIYTKIGYEVFVIAARENRGIAELRCRLHGLVSAFAGPSGVGKSSTINALDPQLALRTGAVSEKIHRGRHTTRYTQLIPFEGGYLADTPGFGNVLMTDWREEEVASCFREFAFYAKDCRFQPCMHTHEPICVVKEAVALGTIAASRYASYLSILEEIKTLREKEGKR